VNARIRPRADNRFRPNAGGIALSNGQQWQPHCLKSNWCAQSNVVTEIIRNWSVLRNGPTTIASANV
jgi:hypothetical protein